MSGERDGRAIDNTGNAATFDVAGCDAAGCDAATCDLSVVVPASNEAESLPDLVERIAAAAATRDLSWEVWIIDDGSTDDTFAVTERLARERLLISKANDASGKPLFEQSDVQRYKTLAERLGGL